MSVTGVTILDAALLLAGVSNTRYGSSSYQLINGIFFETLSKDRIRFTAGFYNYEPIRGATQPEVKSQIVDMNANGSSVIVYSNKPGVSNCMIQSNNLDHWYKVGDWNSKQKLGSSINRNDFDASGVSSMPITLY